MSWLFGYIEEEIPDDTRAAIVDLLPPSFFEYRNTRLHVATGGIPETCYWEAGASVMPVADAPGWAAVGIGLSGNDGARRPLSSTDWATIASAEKFDRDGIDGHYILVRWDERGVEIRNDPLGMRTVYIARARGGIVFSSRLDWLARFRGGTEIDFSDFGPHWLTFNQWSCGSLVRRVERLGQGARAFLTTRGMEIDDCPWEPAEFSTSGGFELRPILSSLVRPELPQGYRLSLGLSGGFDSRLLLALLLRDPPSSMAVHVFGPEDDLDVAVARTIATGEGLTCRHYHDDPVLADLDPGTLLDYAGQVAVAEPVSSVTKLRYYPQLHGERLMMIDGGYGEIGRRQFFNRFLKGGTDALRSDDAGRLYQYIALHRASIFNDEVDRLMRAGIQRQITELWKDMPSVDTIGVGNFLDLLIVRARFPTIGGIEQSRVDTMVWNYMPFAQPSFLRAVFRTPLAERFNGRLYRRLVHESAPRLERYPLVKSNMTYPYCLTTVPSWLWTKGKSMLGLARRDLTAPRFLYALREFVLDLAHSESVRTFAPYNHARILAAVHAFYAGNDAMAREVDWWLTFELWRRSIHA